MEKVKTKYRSIKKTEKIINTIFKVIMEKPESTLFDVAFSIIPLVVVFFVLTVFFLILVSL